MSYTVSYPSDFGIVDVATEISTAQAVLDLGLSNELKEEVLKKIIGAYLPDISDARFDELIADWRKTQQDALYSGMYEGMEGAEEDEPDLQEETQAGAGDGQEAQKAGGKKKED